MRDLENELGIRVIVSTAVAMGTRCQIEIERDIAMIEYEVEIANLGENTQVKDAIGKRVEAIRSSMARLEESIVLFALDLRKQVSKATPQRKSAIKKPTLKKGAKRPSQQ